MDQSDERVQVQQALLRRAAFPPEVEAAVWTDRSADPVQAAERARIQRQQATAGRK